MINQRASAHVSSPKNTSDNQAWGNQFMGKYAGAYSKHTQMQNGQGGGQQVPYTAEDCKNLTQLKAWREGQKKQIKNFVPQAFQDGPMKSIEAEYKKNEARIHNETKVEKDAEEKREEEATEKKEKDEQNDDTREKKGSKPKALSEVPVDNSTNAAAPVELSEQTHSQAFLFVPVLGVAAVLGAAAMSLMHRMRREVVPDQYLSLEAEP
uniref:Uncharacterized protein n=1 Tax=Strombidinopsis acuminata TaxID=141414 RepID=A0A7S3S080_9SPIT